MQKVIKTKYKKVKNFKYKQPVKFYNNIELTSNVINNFKNIFQENYIDVSKRTYLYEKTKNSMNYKSLFWEDIFIKKKVFNFIYNYYVNLDKIIVGSTTPLFPFEIFMLNDGFNIIEFCELNAINPMSRTYKKNDLIINVCFGVVVNAIKTNFYFKNNKSNKYYQINNDIQNYYKSINFELKHL